MRSVPTHARYSTSRDASRRTVHPSPSLSHVAIMRPILASLVALALTAGARQLQSQRAPARAAALDSTITTYCASWGEPDAAKRSSLLARVWAADGTYMDPTPTQANGRAALSGAIAGFLAQNAGAHFRCGAPQSHHGFFRFAWTLFAADGKEITQGMDFGQLDAQGKIVRIVGFWPPPAKP